MDFLATLLLVAGILFVSTFIRSAVGFGDALLAMPLLALIVSLQTATPLVAFMSMMVSAGILITHWQTVDLRSA